MSAWVIALGLGAGYLINRNTAIASRLDNSIAEFQGAAPPATDGATTQELRSALKRTDHVVYGDMNALMPRKQMNQLVQKQQSAASEVEAFDAGIAPPQIRGVMLAYDSTGV